MRLIFNKLKQKRKTGFKQCEEMFTLEAAKAMSQCHIIGILHPLPKK